MTFRYEAATWQIQLPHGTVVELSIRGCANKNCFATADNAKDAAKVLRELASAISRIAARHRPQENAHESTIP